MKRFVIERDIPGIGGMSRLQHKDIAAASNAALARLGGKVQWLHSYVAADKTFCVYLAEHEELVREHACLSGFPVTRITEADAVLEPMSPNVG